MWKEACVSVAWLSYSLRHIVRTHNLALQWIFHTYGNTATGSLVLLSTQYETTSLRVAYPQFLEKVVIFRFERRYPQKYLVARLKPNILAPPNFLVQLPGGKFPIHPPADAHESSPPYLRKEKCPWKKFKWSGNVRPHATIFSMTTQCYLKISKSAQRHNFTIYLEMGRNANV